MADSTPLIENASRSQQCRSVHVASTLKCTAERHIVGVLKFTAHRESVGNPADPCERFEQPGHVEACGVSFHAGRESQNHFLHVVGGHSLHQAADLQQIGANSIHGRDQPSQHVIAAIEFPGSFESKQIA